MGSQRFGHDWVTDSSTLSTSCQELTYWKRLWCWERLKAGGEGDDKGWYGRTASQTQWTWVWASSERWWRPGKPGMLQSMGSQRAGHDWGTEQQQSPKMNINEYQLTYLTINKDNLQCQEDSPCGVSLEEWLNFKAMYSKEMHHYFGKQIQRPWIFHVRCEVNFYLWKELFLFYIHLKFRTSCIYC